MRPPVDLQSLIQKVIDVCNVIPNVTTNQSPIERLSAQEVRLGPGVPATVTPQEGEAPFSPGALVWLLKLREERQQCARFYKDIYRVVHLTPHASRLVRRNGGGQEITATNDRLMSYQDSEEEESRYESSSNVIRDIVSSEDLCSVANEQVVSDDEECVHDAEVNLGDNEQVQGLPDRHYVTQN